MNDYNKILILHIYILLHIIVQKLDWKKRISYLVDDSSFDDSNELVNRTI